MGKARKLIMRYTSYYQGWCLAFGEHKIHYDEERVVNWVEGDSQMGFVVSPKRTRPLFRELLRHRDESPVVEFTLAGTKVNELEYLFTREEMSGAERFMDFIKKNDQLHMYLTSHFCYPPSTRIVTFPPKNHQSSFTKRSHPCG